MKFSIPQRGDFAHLEPAADMQPATTWVKVEDAALPRPLHVRLGVGDDSRLVCTGLLVDSDAERELTARDLRRIPLSKILATIIRRARREQDLASLIHFLYAGTHARTPDPDEDPYDSGRRMLAVAERQRTQRVRRARPGRRGYPDDHYRQVAKAYRQAKRQHPRAPIRTLMNELYVSEPTVHRWLRTAREKGFLDATKED